MKPSHDSTLFTRIGLGLLEHLARHPAAGPSRGRVLLVTSARSGEGKSFVARALSQALAEQQGGDVAWVDAAFDARTAAGEPGRPGAAGFAEIVSAGSLHGVAPAGTGTPRLWALGRGALAQPSLLYRPDAVRQALDALRAGFALTVLDAPRLDACGALVAEVDACVLVIDARRTSRHAAHEALAKARFGPDRMAGVVLNHRPSPLPRWLGGD